MLTRVELTNFKSFRQATVDLSPFTLVLGENGAGKSNLFDALRFLSAMGSGASVRDAIEGHTSASPREEPVAGIRGGSREIVHFLSDSTEFELACRFVIDGETLDYWVAIDAARYEVIGEELTSSRHAGPYVYSTRPRTNPLQQERGGPTLTARFYKRTQGPNPKREFARHRALLWQFRDRQAESLANERVASLVRSELATLMPLELRPEVLRRYSSIGSTDLGEHGENFASLVWLVKRLAEGNGDGIDGDEAAGGGESAAAVKDAVNAIVAWLGELTPHPITEIDTEESPTTEVIFAAREAPFDRLITARSLSDGTLRFAALAFATLALPWQRRTLVIDELENGINPARVELLVRLLEENAGDRSLLQVIASTHSPAVLDVVSIETLGDAVAIGWDMEERTSRAVRLANVPDFQRIVSRVDPGELQSEGWFTYAAGR